MQYCRIWNDFVSWAKYLRQLRSLRELAISTSAPLVRLGGDPLDERRLVKRWVTGRRRAHSSDDLTHGTLHTVRVWYEKSNDVSGFISEWVKNPAGQWYRKLHLGPVIPSDTKL